MKGVRNGDGELVIRPMTDDEKQWLSQFIAETEHGNVNRTEEIKTELRVRSKLVSERFAAKRKGNIDEILRLEGEISTVTLKIEQLRENCNNFYTKESDIQEIYGRDYERRSDVYNTAKISDNLVLYDITEYDKFSTEAVGGIDPENVIMEHLHYVPQKKRKK